MNLNLEEKNLNITEYKNFIDGNAKLQIINLIKEINADSILAKLSKNNISRYLDKLVNSKKLYLFTCDLNKEIIGYAILADKPKYLISEFKAMKFKIFFDLILSLNIFAIFDILISLFKIDLIKMDKKKREILDESLNLNLIAIKNSFRSKGFGKIFLEKIINRISSNKNFKMICCETYSDRAERFYLDKLNFSNLGKKIRSKGYLKVLIKKRNQST